MGTLTIKSDATGTGSLIHSSSGVNATVERYFAGSEQWRLVSSPVASQSISGGWTPAGTYDPPHNVGYDFYAWDEVTSTWLNQRIAGNNITSFVPAKGYLVSFQETDPTKHFSGELNTGSVSISLTKTGSGDYSGTNLVGNPYPSSIDWKAASGWSRSILKDDDAGEGVGYTMYIYNPSANNYGAYISNSSSDEGTHGVTRYIPPMQGFFVVASSAGSFGMDNNVRVHNNAGNFLKNKGAEPNIIRASVTGTNVGSDEVMIEFGNKQGGAPKWNSMVATAPSLWVSKNDKRYSIYFHHNNQQTESLPVSFKAGANGQYTLSFEFAQGQYHTLRLQDLKTNTIHDLLAANSYAFSATTSDDPNRFLLVLGTVGVDENPADQAQLQAYMANGLLWVNNPAENSQLAVFDLSGRMLVQQQLRSKGLQQLSLNLQKGAYILRLTEGNSSLSTKVINQ
ncbi:MAG: T9SS type A sorting domain-containing protein [Bacteroidia bacterium]|nr:T9SS type A sorting domain-containing protein [Bacteroidia bacterium]